MQPARLPEETHLNIAKHAEVNNVMKFILQYIRLLRARPTPQIVVIAMQALFIAVDDRNSNPCENVDDIF